MFCLFLLFFKKNFVNSFYYLSVILTTELNCIEEGYILSNLSPGVERNLRPSGNFDSNNSSQLHIVHHFN